MAVGEYNLVGSVFYGSGKQDNLRNIRRDNQTLHDITISTVDNRLYSRFFYKVNWGGNHLPSLLSKKLIAYKLDLSDNDITNNFLPSFYTTLKKDPEYSNLVTP